MDRWGSLPILGERLTRATEQAGCLAEQAAKAAGRSWLTLCRAYTQNWTQHALKLGRDLGLYVFDNHLLHFLSLSGLSPALLCSRSEISPMFSLLLAIALTAAPRGFLAHWICLECRSESARDLQGIVHTPFGIEQEYLYGDVNWQVKL